jgi:uncharacterized protein YjgD (DUF1641 family)
MAKPLNHTPTPVATDTAHDELQDLLETLHTSGTLRVLNGLFGQFEDVSIIAAQQLDTPGGRNGLSNILLLLQLLGSLDADHVEDFLKATEQGLGAARERINGDAPSLLGLVGALKDEDVRRGLAALLTFLKVLGRSLHNGPNELQRKDH